MRRAIYRPATTLIEASIDPEVRKAFAAWKASGDAFNGVLIGGLALSFYTIPRYTQDIDILCKAELLAIPGGFKKHRPGAIEHRSTGVEIELVTPASINIPHALADKVFATAVLHDGIKVASREGLIALKLNASQHVKRRLQDEADVVALLNGVTVDMSGWHLTKDELATLARCQAIADHKD